MLLRANRPPRHEIIHNVIAHGIFERSDRLIVAGGEQLAYVSLRKILILVANRFRHVDVFDARLAAQRGENGASQIIPRARHSRTDIENAVRRGICSQVQRHGHGVLDVKKIAPLLAVPIFAGDSF